MSAGSAGQTTVDTNGAFLYTDVVDGGCSEFTLTVLSGSDQDALVNVAGIHREGEFYRVIKGQTIAFKAHSIGIRHVFAKGNGGNATLYHGVTGRDCY